MLPKNIGFSIQEKIYIWIYSGSYLLTFCIFMVKQGYNKCALKVDIFILIGGISMIP